jgi:hypothetical protein
MKPAVFSIRQATNGFSGYGSSQGMGGLPHPPAVFHLPIPSWAHGGGGGVSQPTSQAGFPGEIPRDNNPQRYIFQSGSLG